MVTIGSSTDPLTNAAEVLDALAAGLDALATGRELDLNDEGRAGLSMSFVATTC